MSEESRKINRRSFLDRVLQIGFISWLISVLYPVWKYIQPPKVTEPKVKSVVGSSVDEMRPNSGKIVRFGNQPVILIRTPTGEFRAFDAICTHLACIVQYREDLKHIWCACHNGHYDLNGINIAGPPPRPLKPFKVILKEDKVIIVKET
jgi:Rieske Fe-S protein